MEIRRVNSPDSAVSQLALLHRVSSIVSSDKSLQKMLNVAFTASAQRLADFVREHPVESWKNSRHPISQSPLGVAPPLTLLWSDRSESGPIVGWDHERAQVCRPGSGSSAVLPGPTVAGVMERHCSGPSSRPGSGWRPDPEASGTR